MGGFNLSFEKKDEGIVAEEKIRGIKISEEIFKDNAWVEKTLECHTDYVVCLLVSPDGRTLATGSCDNTVRLRSLR